jgi:N-methylhydantoinase A
LDTAAAEQAIGSVAATLGQSIQATALDIIRVANESMVQAIQEITVREGTDPRDCTIVAGGGAAGLNMVEIVRELGVDSVLIPRTAGGLSATGAQFSDIVTEASRSDYQHTRSFDFDRCAQVFASLDTELAGFAAGLDVPGTAGQTITYSIDARYDQQVWEINVPLRGPVTDEASLLDLIEEFHRHHRRHFAVWDATADVEVLSWRARLSLAMPKPPLEAAPVSQTRAATATSFREAYFDGGPVKAGVFDSRYLRPGDQINGPAVIEEPTTTVVLYPGSTAMVTALNNYLVTVDQADQSTGEAQ